MLLLSLLIKDAGKVAEYTRVSNIFEKGEIERKFITRKIIKLVTQKYFTFVPKK